MKNFNFEIIDNKWLVIADFMWFIDDINAIYIDRTCNTTFLYPERGIYIETDSETDLLYYRTTDEIKISKAFEQIVNGLKSIKPSFKKFFPSCYNLHKVKNINWKKNLLSYKVDLEFKNNKHQFTTDRKKLDMLLDEYKNKNNGIEL